MDYPGNIDRTRAGYGPVYVVTVVAWLDQKQFNFCCADLERVFNLYQVVLVAHGARQNADAGGVDRIVTLVIVGFVDFEDVLLFTHFGSPHEL